MGLDTPVSHNAGETRTVRDLLMEKHPEAQPLKMSAVTVEAQSTLNPHPILYEQINGSLIHSIALRTNGAAGPSGIDAAG